MNVDEQPELASAFHVASIPTVVVMKEGQVTDVIVGYRPKDEIVALLWATQPNLSEACSIKPERSKY